MTQTYDRGDTFRISFEAHNNAGALADPSTVRLLIRKPRQAPEVHTWPGGDGVIVHDGAGLFHADRLPDVSGLWRYRWETTGDPTVSEPGELFVRYDSFVGV